MTRPCLLLCVLCGACAGARPTAAPPAEPGVEKPPAPKPKQPESTSSARLTALLPVTDAWVQSRDKICARGSGSEPLPPHRIWRLAGSADLLWRLPSFEGIADDVVAVGNGALLVERSGAPLRLYAKERIPLPASDATCARSVHVFGSWLGWAGSDGAFHFLDLEQPSDTFAAPLSGDANPDLRRVGKYLVVGTTIFDVSGRPHVVPLPHPAEGAADTELFAGGVLVARFSRPSPKAPLGFEWEIQALGLESGKRLARVTLPADAEVTPKATLSSRFGLVVIGAGGELRVASLGRGTSRRVSSTPLPGQIETLAISDDGLVCAGSVVMGRYGSCALTPIADLSGKHRHKDADRVCLSSGARVWTSTLPSPPGRQRVSSGDHTVFYSVCGERLAPDASSAAFLEVKPRTVEEPFTDAMLVLRGTQGGKRHEAPIAGSTEAMYPVIDLLYSPDARYLTVIFDHHAQIFRAADAVAVSPRVELLRSFGADWIGATTFTGAGDLGPLVSLQADGRFALDPSRTVHWLGAGTKDRFALQADADHMLWDLPSGRALPSEPMPAHPGEASAPPLTLRNSRKQTVTFEPITPRQLLVFYEDGTLEVLGDPLSAAPESAAPTVAPLPAAALRCRTGDRLAPASECRDEKLVHGVYRQRFGSGLE
ncbi:MAG: hypothetical protein H6717_09970 [Polyangiaceae bacterium]|nr:hypothetical protein [Polyangiaceae bacterium]